MVKYEDGAWTIVIPSHKDIRHYGSPFLIEISSRIILALEILPTLLNRGWTLTSGGSHFSLGDIGNQPFAYRPYDHPDFKFWGSIAKINRTNFQNIVKLKNIQIEYLRKIHHLLTNQKTTALFHQKIIDGQTIAEPVAYIKRTTEIHKVDVTHYIVFNASLDYVQHNLPLEDGLLNLYITQECQSCQKENLGHPSLNTQIKNILPFHLWGLRFL